MVRKPSWAGLALLGAVAFAMPAATWAACGDGVLDPGEQCDPGTAVDTTCCTPQCTFTPAGTLCRDVEPTHVCDAQDFCSGTSGTCVDSKKDATFPACRPSAGDCDIPEFCDGFSDFCPADRLQARGLTCRPASDACDVAETCDGTNPACPADAVRAAGTTCRAAAGTCDVAEVCNGSSKACPADVVLDAGTVCRAAAGDCDVAETCDGSSPACPANVRLPAGTECRPAAGLCDVAETCNGISNNCPADRFLTGVCRAAAGPCDVAERCTGADPDCPPDVKAAATTVCRAATAPCDAAELCDGSSNDCPADAIAPAGTVCRAAVLGADGTTCDLAEECNGTTRACPTDQMAPRGTLCRAAVSDCDVAETCNGISRACPTDAFAPAGTQCRAANGACDVAENCTGNSNACPDDVVRGAGSLCRAALGACDVAENCNGTSKDCPTDAFKPAGTPCRDVTNDPCDLADSCNGTDGTCPNTGKPNGTDCHDALFCNGEETCRNSRCVPPAIPPCAGGTCNEEGNFCVVCGDGVVAPGEQCGEPGLVCDRGLVCEKCQCVPEGPSLVIEPLCGPLGSQQRGVVRIRNNSLTDDARKVSAASFTLRYPTGSLSINNPAIAVTCSTDIQPLGFSCTSAVNDFLGTVDVVVSPPVPGVGQQLALIPENVDLVRITFTVADTVLNPGPSPVCTLDPAECAPLHFSSVTFGDPNGQPVAGATAEDGCFDTLTCLQGDCNGDGRTTSADVTCDIRHLLGTDTTAAPCGDCNQDGTLTSADITCTILCLFGTCPAPPAP